MESPTSVRPFLRHTTFEFWRQRFSAITVPGSLREGLCTLPMHGYWHAVMTTFVDELTGSRGFFLIPPDGLGMVVSINPHLLLPSKSVLAYVRKQSWSAIFEWDAEKKGWYWHAGDYPPGWEKRVRVINISAPIKKALAKPKFAGKTKPATPLPPTIAPLASRTRGSKRKTTPHPVFATERRVSYFSPFSSLTKLLNFLAANLLISSTSFLLVQA